MAKKKSKKTIKKNGNLTKFVTKKFYLLRRIALEFEDEELIYLKQFINGELKERKGKNNDFWKG